MTPDDFNYAGTYSEMEDEELLEVARDSRDLVEAAKTALNNELVKRGLKAELEKEKAVEDRGAAYCPNCNREVDDPLTCGECASVICRVCGTALQMPEEMEGDQAQSQAAG
jgi:hypothetical protein